MTKHTNITIRDLLEADSGLRALERVWKSTNTENSARAFIRGARKVGETGSAAYLGALWAIGERPSDDTIIRRTIRLSDAMDQLVIQYAHEKQITTDAATDAVSALSQPNTPLSYSAYSTRIHLGIGRPGSLDLRHIQWLIRYVGSTVRNAPRLKVANRELQNLKSALDDFRMLAGQD